MQNTKIEWCDSTWNPITGCLHGCPYCYARGIAQRFSKSRVTDKLVYAGGQPYAGNDIINSPVFFLTKTEPEWEYRRCAFPLGFTPTFHRYRLEEYAQKKPQTIFVGSMADNFGEWVPDEWLAEIFTACRNAPQHRYLFLTKNPHAYDDYEIPAEDNYWYGQSDDGGHILTLYKRKGLNTFLSVEPLLRAPNTAYYEYFKWIIIGAETGNRKDKTTPRREWVEEIYEAAKKSGIPIFMKNSLADVWRAPLIQEYPWPLHGEWR